MQWDYPAAFATATRTLHVLAVSQSLLVTISCFPGAPLMSPGMSPGAPPLGYTRDRAGWLPPAGGQYGVYNCAPYPRENPRPRPPSIHAVRAPEWHLELQRAKSRPVGQFADIIPQVCKNMPYVSCSTRMRLTCPLNPARPFLLSRLLAQVRAVRLEGTFKLGLLPLIGHLA